jgi:NAD-dependent SIR2 family protein deacetylase
MAAMRCMKCDEELVLSETTLEYLGYDMTYELPRCPQCGQVFVSEELARGKMHEVETSLEDK